MLLASIYVFLNHLDRTGDVLEARDGSRKGSVIGYVRWSSLPHLDTSSVSLVVVP